RLEVASHQKKVKGISARLRDFRIEKRQVGVPSGASHYRQVNLRLSQIYLRISQNKRIKDFLVNSLTNVHLSSLLRIVRRRLICDQTLIKLFKQLAESAPPDYMLSDADPVAAKAIVTFKIAYHKNVVCFFYQLRTRIPKAIIQPVIISLLKYSLVPHRLEK
ncbi:unnamed protein product, partial [Gongylonema pulchrum]|uniref:NOG1_N domain-containing protein n=1 Tax=Gongylonema pulchrum TaxID=637853 RepID=A0A183ERM1_9BILA